ncbi:RDD family protein [Gordonia neofelifaecis]|uniref:RDD domain-containing protein n=1 Tax=Gordonia neofelifaecis NRRL B-59395 TaxID=644548 RepID=F1YMZ3_9ACTN|nr:RDD family protein [Gordonia neofelifaecis]EGD53880.1 hypothetical protein SCNU_16503 [Gordonia neofelifaecis NRRL B-59395]
MTNTPGDAQPDRQPDPFAQTQVGPAMPASEPLPPAVDQFTPNPFGTEPSAAGQYRDSASPQNSYAAPQFGPAQYASQPGGWTAMPDSAYAPGYPPLAGLGNGDLVSAGRVRPATIGQRFLARLIDCVIYGIVFAVCVILGLGAVSASSDCRTNEFGVEHCQTSAAGAAGMFIAVGIVLLFGLLYEWLMIGLVGATLGKMAMKIKVVDQVSGATIGLGSAFVRQIIPFIGGFFCGVGQLVVYLSPLFDNSDRMQGWHDKAANDLVIVQP